MELGFAINILKIKLTKTKEIIQKAKLLCLTTKKLNKEYCGSLDVKNISDNKTIWITVKPFLSNKETSTQKITLIDNGKILKF